MPNINETKEVARKVLPIIYVVDTSGSMFGDKIGAVNAAMVETIDVLKDVSSKNPDAEVRVGVLKFSTNAEWVTKNGLEDLEDFFWGEDLEAGGLTDLGSALNELNNKLTRSEYLVSDTGFCVPVIMFMSDGQPTDNYEKALDNILVSNKWYKHATKIAIAVGDDADKDALAKVVGNPEAVVGVTDVKTLRMLIKVASVTSSMINSKSRTTAEQNNAIEIIKATKAELGDDADDLEVNFDDDDSWATPTDTTTDSTDSSDDWDDDGDWD